MFISFWKGVAWNYHRTSIPSSTMFIHFWKVYQKNTAIIRDTHQINWNCFFLHLKLSIEMEGHHLLHFSSQTVQTFGWCSWEPLVAKASNARNAAQLRLRTNHLHKRMSSPAENKWHHYGMERWVGCLMLMLDTLMPLFFLMLLILTL